MMGDSLFTPPQHKTSAYFSPVTLNGCTMLAGELTREQCDVVRWEVYGLPAMTDDEYAMHVDGIAQERAVVVDGYGPGEGVRSFSPQEMDALERCRR